MKKWFTAFTSLFLVYVMCACAALSTEIPLETPETTITITPTPTTMPTPDPTPLPTPLVYNEVEAIDFYELLAEVNLRDKAMTESRTTDEAARAMYKSIKYKNLMTDSEMKAITIHRDGKAIDLPTDMYTKEHIAIEDIYADIDLLKRLLKSCYGPYEYMGGDEHYSTAIDSALYELENIMQALMNEEGYIRRDFIELYLFPTLVNVFSDIRDHHFFISYPMGDATMLGEFSLEQFYLRYWMEGVQSEDVYLEQIQKPWSDIHESFKQLKALSKVLYPYYEQLGGDKAFDEAIASVVKYFPENGDVSASTFMNSAFPALSEALSYLTNSEQAYKINIKEGVSSEEQRYRYFYCENQCFALDETGYYKYINGEKWYYMPSDDQCLEMRITLLESGKLVYSPGWFGPKGDVPDSTEIVLTSKEDALKERITWIESQKYLPDDWDYSKTVAYDSWINENNVGYTAIRSFDLYTDPESSKSFVQSGKTLKNADVVILDVLSNGGGSDSFSRNWIKNFTGKDPRYPSISIIKDSGKIMLDSFEPRWIKQDIPLLVLTDYGCGSSGESAINYAKTLENSIRIGTNSAGCQIGGETRLYRLPNTGIELSLPIALNYYWDGANIDYIGYEPDIWCDGKNAIEATLNMIEYYDINKESLAEVVTQ